MFQLLAYSGLFVHKAVLSLLMHSTILFSEALSSASITNETMTIELAFADSRRSNFT